MPRFYKYDNNHRFPKIPEETETFSSTTSENGSVPKTEVEVLPFKVMMMTMVMMVMMIKIRAIMLIMKMMKIMKMMNRAITDEDK